MTPPTTPAPNPTIEAAPVTIRRRRLTAIGIAAFLGTAVLIATTLAVVATSTATGSDRRAPLQGTSYPTKAAALRAAGAGKPNTLTLVEQNNQNTAVQIDVNGDGFSPGDYIVLNLRLFDEGGTTRVGRGAAKCDFGIHTQTCTVTLRIYGKGMLQIQGTLFPQQSNYVLSIVGGTGAYRGAGGLVQVVQGGSDQILVLHFTR